MESVLIAIAAIVPMLLMLVVIHELGHFATARSLGVKVLEFGVGFPPRAFGFYTGKTRVLISADTQFINLSGQSDLQPGSLVKVSSGEDAEGNLVARVIELPLAAKGLADRLGRKKQSDELTSSVEPEIMHDSDELLKHEGRVRSVEDGSIVLADMLYSVNWAPLGGFVRLAGESNPEIPQSLASKGVGTRFLVLVAGPFMNAILPIAFFTILLMLPQEISVGQVVVDEVYDGFPAQAAGIQPGDIVLSTDGRKIENEGDLAVAINIKGNSPMELLIDRDGQQSVFTLRPEWGRPPGQWLVGVSISEDTGQVVVDGVMPDGPAESAGVSKRDVVVSAGGNTIKTTSDLKRAIQLNRDGDMDWLIKRGDGEIAIQVTPRFDQPETEQFQTGISPRLINSHVERRSQPPWTAFRDSFGKTWEMLVLIKQGLFGAVSSGSSPQLSGPIGIAGAAGELTRQAGIEGWLFMAILLSISLAIFNILPIPALDGGRLVFVVLEWLRRGKRVPPDKEGLVHLIGFVVLIGLIILISANDINNLIQGRSLLG